MGEEHDRLFAEWADAYGRAWAPRLAAGEAERNTDLGSAQMPADVLAPLGAAIR